jgi:arsenate reductase
MVTIYGIKNCDSVKKARIWLEQHRIAYTFHDFRGDGLAESTLRQWASRIGWEQLLNRRSKSWKELSEGERLSIDEGSAIRLMLDNPTLIKRPVVSYGKQIQVGFSDEEFTSLFGQ